VAGFLGLKACGFADPSPVLFIYLFCLLLLFLMQYPLCFRLNCGFAADFLPQNAYGVVDASAFLSVLSPMLSLYRSLLLALSLRCFHFRLNGVGAALRRNAFGFSALFLSLSLYRSLLHAISLRCVHFRLNGVGTALRRNTFGSSALSLFLSLYRFLLLAISLRCFHFRLNGGFGASFRQNAFGFSAPSPFLALGRSHRSLLIVSPSLYAEWRLCHWSLLIMSLRFHFRLNGGVGANFRWNSFGFEREK
jgi:hypothetical protein